MKNMSKKMMALLLVMFQLMSYVNPIIAEGVGSEAPLTGEVTESETSAIDENQLENKEEEPPQAETKEGEQPKTSETETVTEEVKPEPLTDAAGGVAEGDAFNSKSITTEEKSANLFYIENNGAKTNISENTTLKSGDRLRYEMNYKFSDETIIKENDTMTIQLPEGFVIHNTLINFNVSLDSGEIVGTATISSDRKSFVITFNNELSDRKNRSINFDFDISVRVNPPEATTQTVDTSIDGNYLPTITVENNPDPFRGSSIDKNGWTTEEGILQGIINWNLYVNWEQQSLNDAIVTDSLGNGHSYFNNEGKHNIRYKRLKQDGAIQNREELRNLVSNQEWSSFKDGELIFNENNRGFTISLPDSELGYVYYISYSTYIDNYENITESTQFQNNVTLNYDGQPKATAPTTYKVSRASANAIGLKYPKVNFEFFKKLEGRVLESEEFEFNLHQVIDEKETYVATLKNSADGKINYSKVFSELGIFEYKLVESIGKDSSIEYDQKEIFITVEVTDEDKDSRYEAEIRYSDTDNIEGNEQVFTNKYIRPLTSINLQVEKELSGRDLVAGEFEFELTELTATEGSSYVFETAKNDENGLVEFETIEYSKAGVYHYEIREVIPSDKESGMIYDEKVISVEVKVEEENGELKVSDINYADSDQRVGNDQVFTNKYIRPLTSIKLQVEKELSGRDLVAGEFEFELTELTATEGSSYVFETAKNDENGLVEFETIDYTEPGTYTYQIKEVPGENATITYDSKVVDVTVIVEDNNGQLEARVEYPGEKPVFTNDYTPLPTTVVIEIEKVLTGRELQAGEFSFNLLSNDSPDPLATSTNDASGKVHFEQPYTQAGTYNYQIKEVPGENATITYDSKVVDVTVIVEDNNGQLEARVEYPGEKPVFTNDYTPLPKTVVIEIEKVLTGRELQAGEFSFNLLSNDSPTPLATSTNDASGKVHFEQPYTQAGTYTYQIKEVPGENATITYDSKVVDVTVIVEDNNGQLEARVEYPGEKPVFNNTFTPDSPTPSTETTTTTSQTETSTETTITTSQTETPSTETTTTTTSQTETTTTVSSEDPNTTETTTFVPPITPDSTTTQSTVVEWVTTTTFVEDTTEHTSVEEPTTTVMNPTQTTTTSKYNLPKTGEQSKFVVLLLMIILLMSGLFIVLKPRSNE